MLSKRFHQAFKKSGRNFPKLTLWSVLIKFAISDNE